MYEANTGLQVNNRYGETFVGGGAGQKPGAGSIREISLDITGRSLSESFLPLVQLPVGALPVEVFADVSEAFVLGGTSPTILVGTDTSEATNGCVLAEAAAEAIGTTDISGSLTGTWAASLAALTTIGVALGGTTPTVTSAGKVTITVRYVHE